MKPFLAMVFGLAFMLAASGAGAQVVVGPPGGGGGAAPGGSPAPGAGSLFGAHGLEDLVVVGPDRDISKEIGANAFADGDAVFSAREELETVRQEVVHRLQDDNKPPKDLKDKEAAAERVARLIMRIESLEMLEADMLAQLSRKTRDDPALKKRLSDNRELQGTLNQSLAQQKTKRRKLLGPSE